MLKSVENDFSYGGCAPFSWSNQEVVDFVAARLELLAGPDRTEEVRRHLHVYVHMRRERS